MVSVGGDEKVGGPHNVIIPDSKKSVGKIHTHPNEGKGKIVLKNGATLNSDNSRGPSSIDKNNAEPKKGYYNMMVDDKAYYFYNKKTTISLQKEKLK